MKEEHQEEFIQRTNEIGDTLEAVITYLRREKILIDKLIPFLPPSHLEEWGEFLVDWGRILTKFGTQNRERDTLLLKIFGLENDH